MATRANSFLNIAHYSRYLGVLLLILGIPTMILDSSSGAEIPLLVGLSILLVTTSKNEDERSTQIKTSSLYMAFIISYGLKLVITNLHDHVMISFELTEINHFLILTLGLANAIYYGRLYFLKFWFR